MKIVFLDRDGVINRYPGHGSYVTKIKDFHFLPGSLEAIRQLTERGHTIFVISNQACVGRGIISADKLKRINDHMVKGVEKAGGKIRQIFYCTHRPDEGCDCRKPEIGNIKKALKSVGKTIAQTKGSFFVGDSQKDIQAGHQAGCTTIFVLSGGEARRKKWQVKPDVIVKDLKSALEVIQYEDPSHSRHRRSRT
jgi:D-glycero-D-manno-heptose 1,7-bisphosphate phosphatase